MASVEVIPITYEELKEVLVVQLFDDMPVMVIGTQNLDIDQKRALQVLCSQTLEYTTGKFKENPDIEYQVLSDKPLLSETLAKEASHVVRFSNVNTIVPDRAENSHIVENLLVFRLINF